MNLNKNYYSILGVSNKSSEKEVKKAYYKLSFTHHPDRGGDANIFSEITEAYDVLCSDIRTEYDQKSKFGNNYNEYFELFNININYDYDGVKSKRDNFKKNEINDIIVEIDDKFDGSLEFERFVKCKSCDGSGKDMSSKIIIRDNDGNILKMFDGEDGCDLCEGSGQYNDKECPFCSGAGKVGLNQCKTCDGEKRILGKQKLKGIKLERDETRIKSMGHYGRGRIGDLIILRKK
jgi:DnaJ-class molecular chaperone